MKLSVTDHPKEFRLICSMLNSLSDYHGIHLFDTIRKMRVIEIYVEGEQLPCPICTTLMRYDHRGRWFCGKCAHNEFEKEPTNKEPEGYRIVRMRKGRRE